MIREQSQETPTRIGKSPANVVGEHRHNKAVRKLRNALHRLARAGIDDRVTLSVRLRGDDVSVHVQAPMSEFEDQD